MRPAKGATPAGNRVNFVKILLAIIVGTVASWLFLPPLDAALVTACLIIGGSVIGANFHVYGRWWPRF